MSNALFCLLSFIMYFQPLGQILNESTTLHLQKPSAVLKSANESDLQLELSGLFNDENGDGVAQTGETITFVYQLKNYGTEALINASIIDPLLPVDVQFVGALDPGASFDHIYDYTLTNSDIINGNITVQAIGEGSPDGVEIYEDLSDDPENPTDLDIEGDGEPDDPTRVLLPDSFGEVTLIDHPKNLPLSDQYSELSMEANAPQGYTYAYCASYFSLNQETELVSAEFYGEQNLATLFEGLNVVIFANSSQNKPNGNPFGDVGLVDLRHINEGNGVTIINQNSENEFDIRINFKTANSGLPVVLPPGEYWLIASTYIEESEIGNPLTSWYWRFSHVFTAHSPLYNDYLSPIDVWNPVTRVTSTSNFTAEAMAWKLMGSTLLSRDDVEEPLLKLSPIPADEVIKISNPLGVNIHQINIYDVTGKKLKIVVGNESTLNVSTLTSGMYIVIIETGIGVLKQKIIKE